MYTNNNTFLISQPPRSLNTRLDTFGQLSAPTTLFNNKNRNDKHSNEELKVSPTTWDSNNQQVEIPKPSNEQFFSAINNNRRRQQKKNLRGYCSHIPFLDSARSFRPAPLK